MSVTTEVTDGRQSRSAINAWHRRTPPDLRLPLDGSLNNHALMTMPKAPERIRAEYERRGSPAVTPAVVRAIAAALNLHERTTERVLYNLPRSPVAEGKQPPMSTETVAPQKLHGFTRPYDLTPLQTSLWDELVTRNLSPAVKVTETVAAQISRAVDASGPQSIWAAQRWLVKKLGVRLRGPEPAGTAPESARENQAPVEEQRAEEISTSPERAEETAPSSAYPEPEALRGALDRARKAESELYETRLQVADLRTELLRASESAARAASAIAAADADHRECLRLLTEAGADTSGETMALNLVQLIEERDDALAELPKLRAQMEEQRDRFQQQWRTVNRYETELMACLLRHPNGVSGETPLEDRLVTALQATVAELEGRKAEVRLARGLVAPTLPRLTRCELRTALALIDEATGPSVELWEGIPAARLSAVLLGAAHLAEAAGALEGDGGQG